MNLDDLKLAFAISAGEGTLLAYGSGDDAFEAEISRLDAEGVAPGVITLIVGPDAPETEE